MRITFGCSWCGKRSRYHHTAVKHIRLEHHGIFKSNRDRKKLGRSYGTPLYVFAVAS
jgi:hypothetical protein